MKKIWFGNSIFALSLLFLVMIVTPGCGGTMVDPCINFDCPDGTVCVDADGNASCEVPNDNGGGSGQQGDSCSTDGDCATGLTCRDTVNGVPQCEP